MTTFWMSGGDRPSRFGVLKRSHLLAVAAVAGLSAAQTGCGGPVVADYTTFDDLHPVVGEIRYRGEPIEDASIRLYPVNANGVGSMVHTSSAVVDADGRFEVFTYRLEGKGQGAPAGEYLVAVSWSGSLKGLTHDQLDRLEEKLPVKYTRPARSGIRMTVTTGKNETPAIVLE